MKGECTSCCSDPCNLSRATAVPHPPHFESPSRTCLGNFLESALDFPTSLNSVVAICTTSELADMAEMVLLLLKEIELLLVLELSTGTLVNDDWVSNMRDSGEGVLECVEENRDDIHELFVGVL